MAVKSIATSISKFMENVPDEILLGEPENLTIGFMARAMILASIPHSKTTEKYFERRNGYYTLKMMADPKVGLPYGPIPRLILAWITEEAIRTKSRTLNLGKSLAEFLRKLNMQSNDTKTNKRLKDQMNRLFSTAISVVYEDNKSITRLNMYPVKKYVLWWSKDPEQDGLDLSTVLLDEEFFSEITHSPVPFFLEALNALRKSSLAMDIYLWLTYRNSRGYYYDFQPIPWESLQGQFGAGYPNDAQGKADFKRKFKTALKKVCVVYPEAKKLKPQEEGLLMVSGKPHVPKTKKLPTVTKGQ